MSAGLNRLGGTMPLNPNPGGVNPCAAEAWIDRMGCIEFIDDQKFYGGGDSLNPRFHLVACAAADRARMSSAVWSL